MFFTLVRMFRAFRAFAFPPSRPATGHDGRQTHTQGIGGDAGSLNVGADLGVVESHGIHVLQMHTSLHTAAASSESMLLIASVGTINGSTLSETVLAVGGTALAT